MSIFSRVKSFFGFGLGAEGSYRGPAVGWSHWGNPFPVDFGDGFQTGLRLDARGYKEVPTIYACVMAIARAISLCYPQHMVPEGGRHVKSLTSPASRILRKPNAYETWPQFIMNLVAQMMFDGEAMAYAVRDDRFAITSLHRLPSGAAMPHIDVESGAIFYYIGSNPMEVAGIEAIAPARDILHLRRYTPRHPLIGESDIKAAAMAAGINVALTGNQLAFYSQMSRPSGILSTDQLLNKDQMLQLREAFEEQSKGLNAGKIPVLAGGLKFNSMSVNSQDAQLVQAQRMSIEEIARVFGVPLPVIGDLSHATLTNIEATINFWLSTGLGSILENVERSFDALFGIAADEFIEFDVGALLRMDFQARVEGLSKGIQGGLISPNEARAREGLPPVSGGDQVFLQQQMVPVDLLLELHTAQVANRVAANQQPPTPPEAQPDEPPDEPEDDEVAANFPMDEQAAQELTMAILYKVRHEL